MSGMLIRRLGLCGLCALLLMGNQELQFISCPLIMGTPTLTCSDFSRRVPPGTCVEFANPCPLSGEWIDRPYPDGFGFQDRPATIWVETHRAAGELTTRSVCATAGARLVNESIVFIYQRGAYFGTGHAHISTITPVAAVVSATPQHINGGASSQLVVQASGGEPPYFYSWTPTSGLNATNIPAPRATPTSTVTYTVTVTDSAGQTVQASATITVEVTVNVTAEPLVIDPGQFTQLDAVAQGGNSPYTYVWTPTESLDDATGSNPIASPPVTTTYQVTVTDMDGAVLQGSVTVLVSLRVSASAAPATLGPGGSAQLNATAQGGMPPYTYAWTPADSLDTPNSPHPIATPAATTTYTVVVVDATGAMGSAQTTVHHSTAPTAPTAVFTIFDTCCPLTANFDASSSTGNIVSYTWELSWTPATPDAVTATPFYSVVVGEADAGIVTLTVTTSDGQTAMESHGYP